jgi:hypothetical protein
LGRFFAVAWGASAWLWAKVKLLIQAASWVWGWLWQLLILKGFLGLGSLFFSIKRFVFSSLLKIGGFGRNFRQI